MKTEYAAHQALTARADELAKWAKVLAPAPNRTKPLKWWQRIFK